MRLLQVGDLVEELLEISALFDTYGRLLTGKQAEVIKAYYFDDLSLNEIAENEGKSKQAISDLIKRSLEKLFEFEDELSLLERRSHLREDLLKVRDLIESSNDEGALCALDQVIEKI